MAHSIDAHALVAIPLPNGKHAVIWMMDATPIGTRASYTFFVLDGFWDDVPREADVARARVYRKREGALPGEDDRWKAWFQGRAPRDFAVVGRRKPRAAERAAAADDSGTMIFQDAEHLRSGLHREWRWLHDREALEAEWARASDARARKRKARRDGLTLGKMSREKTFAEARWSPRIVREVRRIFRDATRALIDLEAAGTARQRTTILKRIVTELNALDDGFIETPEREAFVARIAELAALVGLSNEDEKLTGDRDW
ncbi:MAG TPA: hypothetical protein VGH28_31255 [Polyangiaceae bacterium]|jgi:hypothetical protein